MEYNEDFTGRWVEALVHSPQSTSLKKGEYAQLLERKANKTSYYFPWKGTSFTCSMTSDTEHVWKLMPIGFKPEIMKENDLVGRYIKIIKEGYFGARANVGDYLKILDDKSKTTGCVVVEKYDVLSKTVITRGEYCTLMPEGFNPNVIEGDKTVDSTSSSSSIPEKWCVNVTSGSQDYPKLYRWRKEKTNCNVGRVNRGFIHSNGRHEPNITDGYTLVTYYYFVSYIYPTFFPEETVNNYKDKFIVGKWYKCYSQLKKSYFYLKYKEGNADYIKGEGVGVEGVHFQSHTWSGKSILDEALKHGVVDVLEIQKFLPDGHADKIKYVPQVGDCVITKGYTNSYDGRILKITKINDPCCYFEVNDGGYLRHGANFGTYHIVKKVDEAEYLAQAPKKDFPSNMVESFPQKTDPMEELLEEAKRKFPIGTKVYSAFAPDTMYMVTVAGWEIRNDTIVNTSPTGSSDGTLYCSGRWAQPVDTGDDDLIAEAKRRYPIGVAFYPNHVKPQTIVSCIVTTTSFMKKNDTIYALTKSGTVYSSSASRDHKEHGGNIIDRVVYCDGEWADIVQQVEKESLLDEAKRRYPVGTSYGDNRGNIFTVEPDDIIKYFNNRPTKIDIRDKGFICFEGKWADIVPVFKKSSLELPEKWFIKVIGSLSDVANKRILEWRNNWEWGLSGYIDNNMNFTLDIPKEGVFMPHDDFISKVYNPIHGSTSASSKHSNTQLVDSYKGLTFLPDVDDRFII